MARTKQTARKSQTTRYERPAPDSSILFPRGTRVEYKFDEGWKSGIVDRDNAPWDGAAIIKFDDDAIGQLPCQVTGDEGAARIRLGVPKRKAAEASPDNRAASAGGFLLSLLRGSASQSADSKKRPLPPGIRNVAAERAAKRAATVLRERPAATNRRMFRPMIHMRAVARAKCVAIPGVAIRANARVPATEGKAEAEAGPECEGCGDKLDEGCEEDQQVRRSLSG